MGKYVGLKAMEELERGREFAIQLRQLMSFSSSISSKRQHGLDDVVDDNANANGAGAGGSTTPSAEDLVGNVLASFTNTLLLLNGNYSDDGRHAFSDQVQVELVEGSRHLHSKINVSDSSSWIIPSNSDEPQHNTSRNTPSPVKDRRGCHRRRKGTNSWEQVSEMSTREDGHAWRKYGQKMILNNKYPRNYYRCTHKFDQGCQATKQVQRIQDEPPLYRTTYYGHHTCTNLLNPEIILDSPPHHLSNSSFLLSFANNNNNTDSKSNDSNIPIPNLFLSSSPSPSPSSSSPFPNNPMENEGQEQEYYWCNMKQKDITNSNINVPSSSSNEYCLLSQHDHQLSTASTNFESHHIYGDVINSSPVDDFYDHHLHHLDALIFDPYEL